MFLIVAAIAHAQDPAPGWWMTEPIRWFQTNLRETDAAADPRKLVDEMAALHVNVLHINVGGITAFYPTRLEFQYASPYLPAGRDLIGDVIREAHARGIRVVGRFDLSKTQKGAFDAHPEWFFRQANGDPVVYNGLYSTCINGGYYRDYAMRILTEALEKYDVDGLFFNMFGNQSRDYSGRPVGFCHCDECKRKYRQLYNKELPQQPDAQYQQFMAQSSREVTVEIGKLIHAKRPKAGYFNYLQETTDGIMSESNTAVDRPLPLWPYASSDNVNRARNSQPGKMAVNLGIQAFDFPWRFATVPAPEIALRIWQNVANGGAAAYVVNGTAEVPDRQGIETMKPVYAWLAAHQEFYAGEQSAARVLLLGGAPQAAYRGIFRFLTEEHIPFAVSDNLDWIGKREFDLVIAAGRAPAQLEGWVANGGRLLVATPAAPPFGGVKVVKQWNGVQGYMRVRDHALFPSLQNVDLLMLNGDYTEVEAENGPALTLVPPSMVGPPEKVHVDQVDTNKPGLVTRGVGKGQLTWIPWDIGALYYRHSFPAHAGLLRDLVNRMLPSGRQVETDAHPLVEMTLMRQGNRTLLHMINLTGHSDTAYFPPVPLGPIHVKIAGRFSRGATQRNPARIAVTHAGAYSEMTIPKLGDYELLVLE